jgi:excisionase family DNA binding protein
LVNHVAYILTLLYHHVMEKDFLSILEMASILDLHPNTIRRAIRNGRINAFKIGAGKKASYRIPRSEIQRLSVCDMTLIINQMIVKGNNGSHT